MSTIGPAHSAWISAFPLTKDKKCTERGKHSQESPAKGLDTRNKRMDPVLQSRGREISKTRRDGWNGFICTSVTRSGKARDNDACM